jgi:hypothetical protein
MAAPAITARRAEHATPIGAIHKAPPDRRPRRPGPHPWCRQHPRRAFALPRKHSPARPTMRDPAQQPPPLSSEPALTLWKGLRARRSLLPPLSPWTSCESGSGVRSACPRDRSKRSRARAPPPGAVKPAISGASSSAATCDRRDREFPICAGRGRGRSGAECGDRSKAADGLAQPHVLPADWRNAEEASALSS